MTTGVDDLAVVMITRNRRVSLTRSLERLLALPERPVIVVVDNGSTDGSPDAVAALAAQHPQLRLVRAGRNLGAVGRNVGVDAAARRYVAFCDDDSWWEPGALPEAARLLDEHPRAAVLVAQVRLHPGGEVDHVTTKMGQARLGVPPDAPGPAVLSFPAFAGVVRVEAFRAVGGFDRLLFFGGEERLLALDLVAAGWSLHYTESLVVRHAVDGREPSPRRWAQQERNDRLVDWLRRPARPSAAATAGLARRATHDRYAALALAGVARRLPTALRRRRPVPAELDLALRREDTPGGAPPDGPRPPGPPPPGSPPPGSLPPDGPPPLGSPPPVTEGPPPGSGGPSG